ncbi:MAG: hypothetical protein MUE36_11015 [Acidimicrobiales bacterium]|jgi:hypothetical protein|nr:hypothetical protein [Acidimicrobiales bacterium]
MDPDPSDDPYLASDSDVTEAASAMRSLQGSARILRVVAAVAAIVWVVTTVSLFVTFWDATSAGGFAGIQSTRDNRLLNVLGQTLQATWGWALVAVIALAVSAMLTGQHLRVLLRALDEDD